MVLKRRSNSQCDNRDLGNLSPVKPRTMTLTCLHHKLIWPPPGCLHTASCPTLLQSCFCSAWDFPSHFCLPNNAKGMTRCPSEILTDAYDSMSPGLTCELQEIHPSFSSDHTAFYCVRNLGPRFRVIKRSFNKYASVHQP